MKSIITASVEVVIILLIVIFVGGPLNRKVAQAKAELEKKQKELVQIQQMIRAVPNPQEEINKIKKSIEELKHKSVSRQELPRIVRQLVDKSKELGIEIVSIRPREDIRGKDRNLPEGVGKAYIEMVIKCPYKKLGEYLKELKDLPIIFTIESMAIEKIEELTQDRKGSRKKHDNDLYTTLILSTYTIWKI